MAQSVKCMHSLQACKAKCGPPGNFQPMAHACKPWVGEQEMREGCPRASQSNLLVTSKPVRDQVSREVDGTGSIPLASHANAFTYTQVHLKKKHYHI